MLKQAFTYARQQTWGSPNVLQLVDRCNKAGVVENWCMVKHSYVDSLPGYVGPAVFVF